MYGFAPRTPLTLGLPATSPSSHHREADDFVLQVRNRHQAAADHVAAAQVRLARRLDARGRPADIRVGHQMYLNAKPEHYADPSVFQARPSAPKRASAGNALRRPPVAAAAPLPRRSPRLQP